MRAVVRDRWVEFTEPMEGGTNYPYADILQLITTGYGNMIDPVSMAMTLPWMIDGRPARADEIAAAWWRVKNDPLCARKGHLYAKTLTNIRLSPEAVQQLVFRKLESNDAVLAARFSNMPDWPACAQMAVHSLAWACGASFHFPKLAAALLAEDYEAAAVHCQINEWNGTKHNVGLIPRNVANRILFYNAARVQGFHLDPDTLDWTHLIAVTNAPTQPELPPAEDPTPLPMVITEIPPPNAASSPTLCPRPLPEEATGSGGILHPRLYPLDDDPDDAA